MCYYLFHTPNLCLTVVSSTTLPSPCPVHLLCWVSVCPFDSILRSQCIACYINDSIKELGKGEGPEWDSTRGRRQTGQQRGGQIIGACEREGREERAGEGRQNGRRGEWAADGMEARARRRDDGGDDGDGKTSREGGRGDQCDAARDGETRGKGRRTRRGGTARVGTRRPGDERQRGARGQDEGIRGRMRGETARRGDEGRHNVR
jgi:hypothetical protein